MRSLFPAIVGLTLLAPLGCTEPPKPEKAQDVDKIERADGQPKIELGSIPDGPMAKVGDVEIPQAQFREIYDLKIKKYADRGREIPPSADRRYRKSIAERLIYHEVLGQEVAKLGVEYDQAAFAERQEQQKRGIRDWDKHLERRGETEQSLEAMTIAELREHAILDKLGKLEVAEDEVAEDYDKIKGNWVSDKPRVRASHILIPIGPQPPPRGKAGEKPPEPTEQERTKWEAEALAKANEVYAQVTAEGADFAKIAAESSVGPSASKGGDIGIFTPDRMTEEFSEVAFALEPGQISKPVKTKFGFHIIKLQGKWPAGELPMDALDDQIRERLRQRKLHQGRRELKERLLEEYTIVDNIAPTLGPEPTRGRRKGGKGGRKLGARNRQGKGPPRSAPSREDGGPTKADPDGGAQADGAAPNDPKPTLKVAPKGGEAGAEPE
ncbi:MAG: peptidylprolyl isomerase [Nannocystaceae bacterium]